jgi:hypothetical protein
MSSISILLKGTRVIVDVIDVVNKAAKENKTKTEKINLIAKSIFTFFESMSLSGQFFDADLNKASNMNTGELFSRSIVFATAMADNISKSGEMNHSDALISTTSMIIEHLSSIARISNETEIIQEKKYLSLSDEEFSKVKRPIYDYDLNDYDRELKIVGYENLDRKDCEQRIKTHAMGSDVFSSVEILSKRIVVDKIKNTVDDFFAFCERFRNNELRVFLERNDLIPEYLEEDPIFQELICPITMYPIRYPLRDPTSGTIYEAVALITWVTTRETSPLTRAHLTMNMLEPCPEEQERINNRLTELGLL